MKHYCKNHPDKMALSFCRSCGEYYCSDCLNEGLEYYYCENEKCNKTYIAESKKRNINTKMESLSKQAKFIKNVATVCIVLWIIVWIKVTVNLIGVMSLGFPLASLTGMKVNVIGFYIFKYTPLITFISWLILSYSIYISIKLRQIKDRKSFIYILNLHIVLIILYNLFIYSYFEFILNSSMGATSFEQYKNYWGMDKYSIAILSLIIIIVYVYLIKKFSSEKLKKEFIKENA